MHSIRQTQLIALASVHIDHETCIEVERVIFGRKRERNHRIC